MEHETEAQSQETPHARWQRRMAARPLPPVQTTWGMEVAPLYTPEDVQHIDDARDLGYPGEFPSHAASIPRCIAAVCGRFVSTPALALPRTATRATGPCSTRA